MIGTPFQSRFQTSLLATSCVLLGVALGRLLARPSGAILSDVTIRRMVANGTLVISPYEPDNVQPCSVDLRLAQDISLAPGESILADTIEWVELPLDVCGMLSGRSGVARLFVQTHCQGGFVDAGFKGT